jgi:hypothetical protein
MVVGNVGFVKIAKTEKLDRTMKPKFILCLALVLSGGLFGSCNVACADETKTLLSTNPPSYEQYVANLLNPMSPEKRRDTIKQLVTAGWPINLPEVLTDVDDPNVKARFLKNLPEPLSKPMLDEISVVSRAEQNSELKLLYGAFLYRYNRDDGLEILESFLSGGDSYERKEVALILALNREDSSAASVVKALEHENGLEVVGSDELPNALGKWQNPLVQDFLKERFKRKPSDVFLALSVSLGDQKEFLPQIERLFRRRSFFTDKISMAAALSRVSSNRDDNAGINFLIDRLPNVMPPPPSDMGYSVQEEPFYIVEALGYCGSVRAETVLRGLLETNWNNNSHIFDERRGLKGKAALALSENLTPENANALAHYLKTATPYDFSPDEERSYFAFNILTADGHPELKSVMTNLVSTNLVILGETLKFKQLPFTALQLSTEELRPDYHKQ